MPHNPADEFEKSLSRQPVKGIPEAWRADILAAAAAPATRPAARLMQDSLFAIFARELSALLWPHPKAWAGLAAAWVLILILNLSMRETPASPVIQVIQPSPEALAELRQQHRLYAELIGMAEASEAEHPRLLLPKPRSERGKILAA